MNAYYVTFTVPVSITARVVSSTLLSAIDEAITMVGLDGIESYHLDYTSVDVGSVTKVESEEV